MGCVGNDGVTVWTVIETTSCLPRVESHHLSNHGVQVLPVHDARYGAYGREASPHIVAGPCAPPSEQLMAEFDSWLTSVAQNTMIGGRDGRRGATSPVW